MIKARTEEELVSLMLLQMQPVIDMVLDLVLEELKDQIDKKVYDAFSPEGYDRLGDSGGLRSLWDNDNSRIIGRKVVGEITEYPEDLGWNPEKDHWQHGSHHWIKSDIRDILSRIVIEGKSGDMFGEGVWREPRDFWTPLQNMLDNGKLDEFIQESFTKYKINFVRIY